MTNENTDEQLAGEEPEVTDVNDLYSNLPLEEQAAALRGDLEGAKMEASQNMDLAKRAQAELVNYRHRAEEERITTGKFLNARLITKLLPVQEELDLAITHADKSGTNASWLEGIKLIQRKLFNLLESEGLASIEGVGVAFNPLEHEALGTEESAEHPPGFIIQVLRSGYRLHDRVIQPAQVIVAREAQIQDETSVTP